MKLPPLSVAAWFAVPAAVLLGAAASSQARTSVRPGELRERWRPTKSLVASVGAQRDERTIIIKLHDDSGARFRQGRLSDRQGRAAGIQEVADALPGSVLRKAFPLPASALDSLRRRGEALSGEQLADLTQYYVLRLPDEGGAVDVLSEVLELGEVENAYFEALRRGPAASVAAPPTGDLSGLQIHDDPAPVGIDLGAAQARGLTGAGVTVCDVEESWNLAHEDLAHLQSQTPAVALIRPNEWSPTGNANHGSAALGVLAAAHNGIGMNGLAPGAKYHVAPTLRQNDPFWIAPSAVLLATLKLAAGDVMLVEVQNGDFTPFETFDLEFAVIKQATALGIHVVEAAGNGALNLDAPNCSLFPHLCDPVTGASKFDRNVRDSGAIFVGAADPLHQPVQSSNFGTRCDAHSWGRDVATLGYGPTLLMHCEAPADPNPGASGPNQYYTACFGGTSSASAVVAGAATLVEQFLEQTYGQAFDVRRMRYLLSEGTPGGGIGNQPDLAHTFDFVEQGGIIEHLLRGNDVNDPPWFFSALGSAVATADLDGDGVSEIIAGAPESGAGNGEIYCWSGASGELLWQMTGLHQFGSAIANVGDIDGDGTDDILVGAPGLNSLPLGPYYAVLFSGADQSWLWSTPFFIPHPRGFGSAVASAGDFNGDAYLDWAVGSPQQNTGKGAVFIYSGAPGAAFGQLIRTFAGEAINHEFGTAIAALGDQDGDGKDDLAIGAPGFKHGAPGPGPGGVFTLGDDSITPEIWRFLGPGNASGCRFGDAVANAGDLDGDDADDLLIGAPLLGPDQRGAVYVVGGGPWVVCHTTIQGDHAEDRLGSSVGPAGDFDGDGDLDIAAGSPSVNPDPGGGERPARVFVYANAPDPDPLDCPTFPTRFEFDSAYNGTALGASLSATAPGDLNEDGSGDLVAGAPTAEGDGRVYVFARQPGPPPAAQPRIVAVPPMIEACDTSLPPDGTGGGGFSPDRSTLHVQGGPAFANRFFSIKVKIAPPFDDDPVAESLLFYQTGMTDSKGEASFTFGPHPASVLSAILGAEYQFRVVFGPPGGKTNWTSVCIVSEFGGNCP